MKQKFLLLAMALLGCMNVAKAEDYLTIDDAVVQQGGFGYISVKCHFEDRYYNAFSIKFFMPEGLHFDSGKADASLTGIDNPMFPMSDGEGTTTEATFIFMNMQGLTFKMGEYEILRIYFRAEETMPAGTYPINITELNLSGNNGVNYGKETPEKFNVTIETPHPRILKDTATELPEDNYSYLKVEYEAQKVQTTDGEEEVLVETSREEGTVAEDFTVQRTIKADTWSTLCLPFEMTFDELYEAFGDDAVFAAWTDPTIDGEQAWVYDKTNDKLDINFYTLDPEYDGESFDARMPFLVKTSKTINEFTVKNKYLGDYDETQPKEADRYTSLSKLDAKISKTIRGKGTSVFQGVFTAGLVPENGLFMSGNKFYYSTGNSSIKAFRAYFNMSENLVNKSLSQGANVGIMIDDTPTYIEGISTKFVGNDDVYSVSGIKMGTTSDLNHMKPGMYIVNGKKVIVK